MLRLLLLPFLLPFSISCWRKSATSIWQKSTFDLKQTFLSGEISIVQVYIIWFVFDVSSVTPKRIVGIGFNFLIFLLSNFVCLFVFFTAFSSQSCLSDWREIYELTKVKQVRRGTTSCHPRSCLLSAPSNTDTPPRTLLYSPLNPPTALSFGPPSVYSRRKKERGRDGEKDGRSFLRGARRYLVTDTIWQQKWELRGIL